MRALADPTNKLYLHALMFRMHARIQEYVREKSVCL